MGDFKWMIENDVYPHALYVFNDNDDTHATAQKGRGNASVRPYNKYARRPYGYPRSAGVCTGYKKGSKQGFQELNDDVKRIIDRTSQKLKHC